MMRSANRRSAIFGFWMLVDEILNSVLFLLIGLEVLVLRIDPSFGWLAAFAVPLVLLGRLLAVSIPGSGSQPEPHLCQRDDPGPDLGRAARRHIDCARAFPAEVAEKSVILAATYAVVLFTIVVQGLSLGPLVKRVVK